MGQQDSLQFGQNCFGAGNGFVAGNSIFQLVDMGAIYRCKGLGVDVMPNQNYPQMVPVGLGLGQFGFMH